MKRLLCLLVCAVLLCGCRTSTDAMDRPLGLRSRLLEAERISFDTTITADYGDYLHTFVLRCHADNSGAVNFEVVAPDTISGITGSVDGTQGNLTFDDEILAFSPLVDGRVSPVAAPWILVHTLLSGYITTTAETEHGLLVTIDDSYDDDALTLEIRLDQNDRPSTGEIIWQGRRILSLQIENFQIL